jgi:hypothetical protein
MRHPSSDFFPRAVWLSGHTHSLFTFAGAAAAALAINLLYAALIHLAPAGSVAAWIDNWGTTLLAASLAVPATLAGRNNRGRRRWAWWLIGLGRG